MAETDQEGEVLELEDPITEVEDTDDGGAIVRIGEEEEVAEAKEFYDNIVDEVDEIYLERLATQLLEDIERDKKAREKRDKDYAEAIKRTGLGKEAPGGAEFEGASKVVHPLLTEACVDFAARAIRELMPPNGPVKVFVPGKRISRDRFEKAERKKTYMNWQFLIQMPDFRTELEQLLTQLPLGGSQYLRLVYDSKKKRPVPVFVPVDDIYLPYAASNFYTAERQTYCEHITKFEFESRVSSGMYRDIGEIVSSQLPTQTEAAKATDKVEGRDDSVYNEDGLRDVFEVCCFIDLNESEQAEQNENKEGRLSEGTAPYRVSVDAISRKVVAVNRNWDEEDEEKKEALFWTVEFPFVPWRGAYSIGLGQMIGSLSGAATGALRALLDSAHINNLPTLIRLKGANFSGQSKELNVAEVTEIEGGIAADDIRKLIMAVPYNPPSDTLMNLLGFCVDAGRGVVQTTFEKLADQKADMPVGTTLALIEEGMKVMSAIHLRLYHAMNYVIRILHRIDRMYLEDEDVKDETGEVMAHRDDFQLPLDVVPVADPEIFSDVQRLAQIQIVADRAAAMPDLYNQRAVEKRLLERTRIPNPDELLNPIPEAEEMNAVNENSAMVLQRPVAAFPEQDHLAHLQVHLDFMQSPVFGQLPIIAPSFTPLVLDHIKEHLALWYVNENFDMLKMTIGKNDEQLKQILEHQDPETRAELDKTLAAASQKIMPRAMQVLAGIPPIIQQAMQFMQSMQPQPQIPSDPNKMAALEQKSQSDQLKAATTEKIAQLRLVSEDKKLQQQKELKFTELSAQERQEAVQQAAQEAQQANEFVARLRELQLREQAEDERTAQELASREKINAEDNLTALSIAEAEIASGEKVSVETGTGLNPSG